MQLFKTDFTNFIHQLQNEICAALEQEDGKAKFVEDEWQREGGGGGKTRILTNGNVFEKGGVNTSVVYGVLPPVMQENLGVSQGNFFACGISLVLHPYNPFVPTVHANYRYFELYDEAGNIVEQWFGGGSDLTPYYLFDEDAAHFHHIQRTTADALDTVLYPKYKAACDKYFRNHHRDEARGIGGTFFDYLGKGQQNLPFWFDFTTRMGNAFLPSYLPIVQKRKNTPFSEQQKYWQEIRRGRYVEFNLIHDKGTLFGLKTNGRIESIFMSLPATVRWDYNFQTEPNSPEAVLLAVLKTPKEWV